MALPPSFLSAALLRAGLHYPLRGARTLLCSTPRPAFFTTERATFGGGENGRPIGPLDNGGGGGDGDNLFASARYGPRLDSSGTKGDSALFRVVSYNLLSPPLARSTYFKYCDPADLVADIRLSRTLKKLEEAVASKSVICLQEVSLSWSGPLHTFFSKRGFHLIMGTYGSYFNGYMGVGLAFPTDLYDADDVRVQCLTDNRRWPREKQQSPFERAMKGVIRFFTNENSSSQKRSRSPWLQARDRKNVLIFARLRARSGGASLCVGTYHMPCMFWSPAIMLIHSALVVSTFQRLANGSCGVLAGDFNIKPYDTAYRMITTGAISPTHPDFPPNAPDGSPADKWFPRKFKAMRSAYAVVNGEEPDFTNYARTGDQPEFIETLDYLFCTESVEVVDVLPLPKRSDVKGPFPVKDYPSDHIMIGATLRTRAANTKSQSKHPQRAVSKLDVPA